MKTDHTKPSNRDLVNQAFRILPAYLGTCIGYLVQDFSLRDGGNLWRVLAILTGLIALVSSVAFWLAGKRAYVNWMLTADLAAQEQATKSWAKVRRLALVFGTLGVGLGLLLGHYGMNVFLSIVDSA